MFLGGPVFIFGVIAVVLYLIFITLLGLWSTWRRLVVADGNSVSKRTRICGATVSSWREPLRNFEGIEYAMKVIKADSKRERRIDHRIVLRHPEKKRCAILLARELREVEEQAEIRLLCRSYATALNVPELRRVAGVDATRAVGELGKPVWELVAEGKVKTEFDPRAALPRRIHLQKSEDQHAFLIDPRPSVIRVFWIFRSVLLAVVVLIVWLMVTADREFLLPGLSLTFFIGLFFLLHGVATRKERSQQALVLRRQSISLGYVEKNKSLVEERKLEPKSIEILDTSIKGRLKFNLAEGKEVRSRRLGAEAGRWLCQYLLWLYGTKWYASAGGK